MAADQHTSYFNVLDALKSETGCALCFLEAKAVRSSLESVMYESVNDRGVRAALGRSKGYCRAHAATLLDIGDAFGTAILYQDVVRDLREALQALDQGRRVARSRWRVWLDHAGCPACRIQHEARNRYGGTLLSGLSQEEMRSAFDASAGLCVPHLLHLLDAVTDQGTRAYLIETHRVKYGRLLRELEEFCRKHDYRHAGEGFGREGDSWRRAVRMMVGGHRP
ncbi:MAG: hypothetical protein JXB04_07415 [Kiritimatiellae bacterium]|nr:hypothetical protein [Kiritimatiellia bacterium]